MPGDSSKPRILIVAGSDSGGGAGIQADIKTVTMLGGYAATAVTAVTVQNTKGVEGVHPIPADVVAAQMRAVLTDIGADAVKLGMLHDAEVIAAVARTLDDEAPGVPVILDPVMVAKGGARLLDEAAETALREELLPRARLITPNVPEAEALTGLTIDSVDAMKKAGEQLKREGAGAVLVKGGHLQGDTVSDILVSEEGVEVFTAPRIETRHTHGTGCTLASALAVYIGGGAPLSRAVVKARAYVLEAIRRAPGLGGGHGPLEHAHVLAPE
ncbi:MAG: bifunctional hydroxymethylpyrimidine kinase/phosphomethylpyrimidine kinase [Alphaproteobacteria bacterium]